MKGAQAASGPPARNVSRKRATAQYGRFAPMTATRLSALDASFLTAETPTAHMHVGWTAIFDPPADGRRPSFQELRDHIAARVHRAPRYRQRLATVPFGLHDPVWVDDARFDISRHV